MRSPPGLETPLSWYTPITGHMTCEHMFYTNTDCSAAASTLRPCCRWDKHHLWFGTALELASPAQYSFRTCTTRTVLLWKQAPPAQYCFGICTTSTVQLFNRRCRPCCCGCPVASEEHLLPCSGAAWEFLWAVHLFALPALSSREHIPELLQTSNGRAYRSCRETLGEEELPSPIFTNTTQDARDPTSTDWTGLYWTEEGKMEGAKHGRKEGLGRQVSGFTSNDRGA